ncbi:sigma 54-interacting transcriptional regulator [Sansalvadorimonas sp. 2012CJ34-2]|uniref:Sigma 54-interacting transcriptional regulator n=1 Tax=Parendozoicomonas callyspongiae TaxID=2942213 RepID=A0ABT0PJ39_9GAMM|nr:sigma 54-interacting transcriptional regulator [Sansalvadorimonas sp. 2012CJ34-2]MCL6271246.1 sigma 54-interacting transcriptional regulator [Sansalvadorimonas sp. 2012CJ34-2]
MSLQSKLLRVLQYDDLQRIGDDRSLWVNTRIVAATNKNFKHEVMENNFCSGLYYRLSVFPIAVPPLENAIMISCCWLDAGTLHRLAKRLGLK